MPFPGPRSLLRRVLDYFRGERSGTSSSAHQVAALPVKVTASGRRKVLLVSTRGSGKLIIPRGWPMKGKADFQAAAIEAEEEAGVLGTISLHPIGAYEYHKPKSLSRRPIRVDVYQLDVRRQLPRFKEKGQRRLVWLDVEDAAQRVGEPGLVGIIRGLLLDTRQAT